MRGDPVARPEADFAKPHLVILQNAFVDAGTDFGGILCGHGDRDEDENRGSENQTFHGGSSFFRLLFQGRSGSYHHESSWGGGLPTKIALASPRHGRAAPGISATPEDGGGLPAAPDLVTVAHWRTSDPASWQRDRDHPSRKQDPWQARLRRPPRSAVCSPAHRRCQPDSQQ